MLFLLNYCMVIGKLRKTISENREPDKYTGDQTRQDQDISKPMAIKDEIRKENLKLKDMPFKKKVSYIWDYYKFPIIGLIAASIFLCTFIKDYRQNRRPVYLDAILINSDLAYGYDNPLTDDYIEYAGVDTEAYNLTIDSSIVITENSYDQMTMANVQKVFAMYSAGELDVVIAPEPTADEYGAIGAHMDLTGLLTDEFKKELEDKGFGIYYTTEYEEDENGAQKPVGTYPAGIYINNSEYLKRLGNGGAYATQIAAGRKPVFTITATSTRTDNALKLLRMITGK